MSAQLPGNVSCAKGPIPYCLDELSKGRGARARLQRLSEAIALLAPDDYQGLETVLDTYLLAHVLTEPQVRARVVAHLKRHWFDPSSSETYFPDQRVARIYAEGMLKALELSLKGRRTVPINAWWIVDAPEVKMVTLADVDSHGVTVGGRVTLLILTPRPRPRGEGESRTPILGNTAAAWVSEQQGAQIATFKINELRWGLSR